MSEKHNKEKFEHKLEGTWEYEFVNKDGHQTVPGGKVTDNVLRLKKVK